MTSNHVGKNNQFIFPPFEMYSYFCKYSLYYCILHYINIKTVYTTAPRKTSMLSAPFWAWGLIALPSRSSSFKMPSTAPPPLLTYRCSLGKA